MRPGVKFRATSFVSGALAVLLILTGATDHLSAQDDPSLIGPPVPPGVRARLRAKKTLGSVPAARPVIASQPASTARPTPAIGASDSGTAAPAAAQQSPSGRFAPVLPPADYAPPALFIAEKRHDFGEVFQGEQVVHKFVLENKGNSDLLIERIKPSCGCTYVDHDKVVKPGGQGYVTLKIDTNRLRAGAQSKSADIFSNDPKAPTEKVYITGTVKTVFDLEPKYPRLDLIRGTGEQSTIVLLRNTVGPSFKVTGVRQEPKVGATAAAQSGKLDANIEDRGEGNYALHVSVAANDSEEKARNFYEKLVLDIEGENGRKLTQEVSVTVSYKDRIGITPRTVWFRRNEVQTIRSSLTAAANPGSTPAANPVAKTVRLTSEVPEFKFNVTKVEAGDPHFGASVKTIKEGSEYEISVTIEKLPDDATVRSLKGDITVHTDDPANPTMTFRVIAYL